ncbi:DUF2798 domain-containing protein [Streptococcus loxodontisalivarius]|uniref:DUF2798 domain-containing protein n=1 Tax=Streptococcus loxodontisalivarius TaxID=1349415 RepID=A0ABS2PQZ1_9STRE|nr:DUF2798 domain-containing protein [Streptococcus loxodontisalivarius]MBM7642464.1 hypothetical protein [Streptococcus loxodontisalivarius]
MPRNFKEAMIFTCLMCGMMVFGMSIWNLIAAGHFSWSHVFLGYIPGFIVAFLLDVLVVGPIAKKVAISIIMKTPHHEKRWVKIVGISGCMVLGMVSCMSLYGLIFNLGWSGVSWSAYGQAWITNFVVALPLNFIIVGPIARYILGHFQKPFPGEEKVEDFEDDEELPTIV